MSTKAPQNEDKESEKTPSSLFSKALKNFSASFALTAVSKLINLSCNIVLGRKISKEAFGIAKIYFELAFAIVSYLPRTTTRKAAQKHCADKDNEKQEKKYYIAMKYHNILMFLMIFFCIFLFAGFMTLCKEDKVRTNFIQLIIYIGCGMLEMLMEPIICIMNLKLENTQPCFILGNFGRIISNVLFCVIAGMDLWSFTLSRLVGSCMYSSYLIYLGVYKYKISFDKTIPFNIKELLFDKTDKDGFDLQEIRGEFLSFGKNSFLNMIISKAENFCLSFFLNRNSEEKGEYSFIVDNFAFFVRFILQPLEDNFYNLVSVMKDFKEQNNNIQFDILKVFMKPILTIATLLVSYFFLAGSELFAFIYGPQWGTPSCKRIGTSYIIYMCILAVNGIVENFANAICNSKVINKRNYFFIFNTISLFILMNILSRIDICGIIVANGIGMISRIIYNLCIIANREGKEESGKLLDYYMSMESFGFTMTCAFVALVIKKFVNSEIKIVVLFLVGIFGLVNVAFIYVFEHKKYKEDIKKVTQIKKD